MAIRIGTRVKVVGTNIVGKVTHIRWGDQQDPNKYRVSGRYWNKKSIRRK